MAVAALNRDLPEPLPDEARCKEAGIGAAGAPPAPPQAGVRWHAPASLQLPASFIRFKSCEGLFF